MRRINRIARIFVLQLSLGAAVSTAAAFAGCSSSQSNDAPKSDASTEAASAVDAGAASPIDGLSPDLVMAFNAGVTAFNAPFAPSDGLGPLYTKTSCDACHGSGSRGPGIATKMAVVESDGVTPSFDQSLLPWGDTEHPLLVAQIPGVHTPIMPPFAGDIDGGDAGLVSIRTTTRIGPPLFGRGYLEAVEDSEIERVASAQSVGPPPHGRINHVTFASQPNPDQTYDTNQPGDVVIGRFGLKGRIATLDEFSADALQGDIGITSPMRPTEFANPDHVTDDLKPGVDVTADEMNARANYARLLAIPPRIPNDAGKSVFWTCGCISCHVPTMHTRADYPIPQLADIDAPIYTDMLLHDMGTQLADSVTNPTEGEAGPQDWRTPPLIGLRFATSYLHDGRAQTIGDAIALHNGTDSEGQTSAQCYLNLSSLDQQNLVGFVQGL